MELALMGAGEAAAAIRDGLITSEALVKACLEQIDRLEEQVQAWAYLDPELALEQARGADRALQSGKTLGPLHGVPVGIKDIIDTNDMPTENGTVLHSGRQPKENATIIIRLQEAGAVILGKTVTTELAVYSPGKTRNPHDLSRTPGGSSSGSAAAVASGMVPIAIGTQTNGSVIRPASFCGVYGFKPTFGQVSRHLVLKQSPPLDQIGVFARSIGDAALVAETIIGFDSNDSATWSMAKAPLFSIQSQLLTIPPRFACVKTPVWEQADEATRIAFTEFAQGLGKNALEVDLPDIFMDAHEQHRIIMEADLARSFEGEYIDGREKLSALLLELMERGRGVLAEDYDNAVADIASLSEGFDEIFKWHDAIITPATIGEAPVGLESTGSPVFCTIWTLCGMPAITLPLLQGENGMPIGVQLVGPRGDDARLLRTARWLVKEMSTGES